MTMIRARCSRSKIVSWFHRFLIRTACSATPRLRGSLRYRLQIGRARFIRIHPRLFHLLIAAASAAVCCGCAEWDMRKNIPWGESKDKPEVPNSVVAFWTDAVQNVPGTTGKRGFGGRLYFYGKTPNKPVKVDGAVVVYAFDETNRDPRNVIPDKKFVFSRDQFKNLLEKTEVGPSYNLWLPWDEVGGQEKQISLIARFTSEKGEMCSSEQSKMLLPGMPPPDKQAADALLKSVKVPSVPQIPLQAAPLPAHANAPSGAVQAAYQQPITAGGIAAQNGVMLAGYNAEVPANAAAPDATGRMETTTIDLPYSLSPRAASVNPAMTTAPAGFQVPAAGPIVQPLMGASPGVMPAMTPQQMMMPTNSFGRPLVSPAQNGASVNSLGPVAPGTMMNQQMMNSMSTQGASMGPNALGGHSGFGRSRVLGAPLARLDRERDPSQPNQSESPFGPASGQKSGPTQ